MAISAPAPTCNTTYCSTNCCKYGIINDGLTSEIYSYTSCTDNSYITTTIAPSEVVVVCSVGPPICSFPVIYGLEGCCDTIYAFQECQDSLNKFILTGITSTLTVGEVYYIVSGSFTGYASVIPFEQVVNIYDGSSAILTEQISCPSYSGITTGSTGWSYYNYCGDIVYGTNIGQYVCVDTSKEYFGINVSTTLCTQLCVRAALLQKCSDSSVFYGLVDEDTAFTGAVYVYQGDCYSFIEFSGPGGPQLGEPDYADCAFCTPSPSIPITTPTITPSITSTIPICSQNEYCFKTNINSLFDYSGIFSSGGTYNSRNYYVGNGVSVAYIYFNNVEWCLSSTLGGICLLKGASPCLSSCPDFNEAIFYSGICVTPTPTQTPYSVVDFDAVFECDFPATPTVTATNTHTPTPTPTPTITSSQPPMVGLNFNIVSTAQPVQTTVTPTPSLTLTKTVSFSGSVNFTLFEKTFDSTSSKVMRDCTTNEIYYVGQNIVYNLSGITIGQIIKCQIGGNVYCLEYLTNDNNIGPNVYINNVIDLYENCSNCFVTPTPTPTITSTITPSVSPTITPTPSVSSNMVYVFKTCFILPEQTDLIYLKQTEPHVSGLTIGNVVKDSDNNCWEYIGIYPTTYVNSIGATQIEFLGNYFLGVNAPVFSNCNSC